MAFGALALCALAIVSYLLFPVEQVNVEGNQRLPEEEILQNIPERTSLIAISARRQGIEVCRYSRLRVRKRFSVFGVGSKDDMAAGVAAMLPALGPRLPRRRKPWESEHYGMAIFEAAALGITHFAEQRR